MNKPKISAAVCIRELRNVCTSWQFYVIAAVFLCTASLVFFVAGGFFLRGEADITPLFSILRVLLCMCIPLLTMGSWAAERTHHTDALLLSLPISEPSIVVQKWCAAFIQVCLLLFLTVCISVSAACFGAVNGGIVVSSYAGLLLFSAAGAAAGIFFSVLCGNQPVSFAVTVFFLAAVTTIDKLPRVISVPSYFAVLLTRISFSARLSGFFRGIFDSRDCLFFAAAVFIFLRLTVLCIVKRRGTYYED